MTFEATIQSPADHRHIVQAALAGWTPEYDDKLRTMLTGEFSLTQIGAECGGKTKASVARRIKRLGLVTPADFRAKQMTKARWGEDHQARIVTPIPAYSDEEISAALIVGIDALEPHHCRFILNDDMSEPAYCGLPQATVVYGTKERQSSYCAKHHRITHGRDAA